MSTYFTYLAAGLALLGLGVVLGAVAARRLSLARRRVVLVVVAMLLVLIAVLDTPRRPWSAVFAAILLGKAILDLRRERAATGKPEPSTAGTD